MEEGREKRKRWRKGGREEMDEERAYLHIHPSLEEKILEYQ